MPALETQLQAFNIIEQMHAIAGVWQNARQHGFDIDRTLLKQATPFMWSNETIQAAMTAGKSIPADTTFNQWNLDTPACWWWFETPLPYQTLESGEGDAGVRALCFGWITIAGQRAVGCSTWTDNVTRNRNICSVTPTQTWAWSEHATLEQMLVSARLAYSQKYGPGGQHEHLEGTAGVEVFAKAAEGLSRFVLAGLAWIGQKVLVESEGAVERHRRKDFNRHVGQNLTSVRVVHLRKATQHTTDRVPGETEREYSHRFVVGGHWRNQACGVKHGDRRLTWVHPYIKGPDDKPLKPHQAKVYMVNR